MSHFDAWVWVSLSLSFLSMSATFSSLMLELPFQIGTTVYTPIRSLCQLIKLMVPMTLSLAIRLWYIIWVLTIYEWEFSKYLIPGVLAGLLILSSFCMLWAGKSRTLDQEMKEEAVLAAFTSAFLPCVQVFGFYSFTNFGNLLWFCLLAFHFGVAFFANISEGTTFDLLSYFFTFIFAFIANYLNIHVSNITQQTNNVYVFKDAIDSNDDEFLESSTKFSPECMRYDSLGQHEMKNTIIPGEGLASLAYAASKKHTKGLKELLLKNIAKKGIFGCLSEVCCCFQPDHFNIEMNKVGSVQSKRNHSTIQKIEKLEQTGIDLQEFNDKTESEIVLQHAQKLWDAMIDSDPFYNKSAFMISCQLKDVLSIEYFMNEIRADVFDLDYNLRDHKKRSAFILACQEIEYFDEEPQEETHHEIEDEEEEDPNEETRLEMGHEPNEEVGNCCTNAINRIKQMFHNESTANDDEDNDQDDEGNDQEDEDNDQDDEDIEPRKKVVKLFLEHAERLKIKLDYKDDQGKSGFHYLPEDWIEEFRTDYPEHFQF